MVIWRIDEVTETQFHSWEFAFASDNDAKQWLTDMPRFSGQHIGEIPGINPREEWPSLDNIVR